MTSKDKLYIAKMFAIFGAIFWLVLFLAFSFNPDMLWDEALVHAAELVFWTELYAGAVVAGGLKYIEYRHNRKR